MYLTVLVLHFVIARLKFVEVIKGLLSGKQAPCQQSLATVYVCYFVIISSEKLLTGNVG